MMDYETLKAKQDEIRAKREKLLAECEMYEEDISKIQREMAKLDHTKILLNDSTELMLRNYLDHNKSQSPFDIEGSLIGLENAIQGESKEKLE